MTGSAATVEVRRVGATVAVVDVSGAVTAASEPALADAFERASGDRTRAIVLNFGGLEYMNSGGIGLLVTLLVRANRQGRRLLAYGLNEHYRHIFELTRLSEAIRLYDDETSAVSVANAL